MISTSFILFHANVNEIQEVFCEYGGEDCNRIIMDKSFPRHDLPCLPLLKPSIHRYTSRPESEIPFRYSPGEASGNGLPNCIDC